MRRVCPGCSGSPARRSRSVRRFAIVAAGAITKVDWRRRAWVITLMIRTVLPIAVLAAQAETWLSSLSFIAVGHFHRQGSLASKHWVFRILKEYIMSAGPRSDPDRVPLRATSTSAICQSRAFLPVMAARGTMQNLDKIDLGLICVAKLFIVQFKVLAIFMPSKSRATSCA